MARHQQRPLTIAAFLLLVLLVPLNGQGVGAEETVHRTVLRFYPYGTGEYENILVRQPGPPERVETLQLAPGRRSPALHYSGPEKLILWRPGEGTEKGHKQFHPLGTVALPRARETLIFLIANPLAAHPGEPEFHLFAMDDGHRAVPENHLAFFNLTGAQLTGWVGDQMLQLESGLSQAIDVRPFFNAQDVLVALTVLHGGEERIVLENRIRFIGNRRSLIVLLPPVVPGSVEIRAFRIDDRVPSAAVEQ